MDRPYRIAAFNAENFSLLLDRPLNRQDLEALDEAAYQGMNTSIYYPNKERTKVAAIAELLVKQDFDLVGLCEVGGLESLRNFNRLYLDEAYEVFLHEENSKRGIYVGALVKKGVFPGTRASAVPGSFARNLLCLDLGDAAGQLRVYVVHLKSQFGRDWGIEHRISEVEKLSALVRRHNSIVMGDFNGLLIRGEHQFEYEAFLKLPFRDVLDSLGIPPDRRRTHYHFGPEPRFTQLDYLFCSPDLVVVEGGVIEGEIPLNRAQRQFLPSDHLPLWALVRHRDDPVPEPPPPAVPRGWWARLWGWTGRVGEFILMKITQKESPMAAAPQPAPKPAPKPAPPSKPQKGGTRVG